MARVVMPRIMPAHWHMFLQLAMVGSMVAVYLLMDRFVAATYVRTIVIVALALLIVLYYSYRSRQLRLARLRAVEEMQTGLHTLSRPLHHAPSAQLVAAPSVVIPVATIVGQAASFSPEDARRYTLVPGLPVRMLGSAGTPALPPPVAFSSASPAPTGAPLELLLERLTNAASTSEVTAALEAVLWWASVTPTSECLAASGRVTAAALQKRGAAPELWSDDVAALYGRVVQRLRGYSHEHSGAL